MLHSLSVMFCLRCNSEFLTYILPSLPSGASPIRVMGVVPGWAERSGDALIRGDGVNKRERRHRAGMHTLMEGCVCERCKEELSVCAGGVTHICSSGGSSYHIPFLLENSHCRYV